jgi:alpha-mannosidase
MSAKTLFAIAVNHMDPIWNHRWHGEFTFRGGVYRGYDDIEETQIGTWLAMMRDGRGSYSIEQTLSLRMFLERNPDQIDVVRERLRRGQLEILGGGETVVDYNLIGGESIVRNHLTSIRWCRRNLGLRPAIAATPDTFGYSAQMPQVFRQLGYARLAFAGRGFEGPEPFWRGLDGSLLCLRGPWETRNGKPVLQCTWGSWHLCTPSRCCNGDGCPLCGYNGHDVSGAMPWDYDLQRLRETLTREDHETVVVLWQKEEGLPDPRYFERLEELARDCGYAIRFTTVADGIAQMDPVSGDAAGTKTAEASRIKAAVEANPVFPGCYVSRIRLKQWNRELEGLLRGAETASAFAQPFGLVYPRRRLERLWQRMALLQFHDGITGTQSDAAYDELRSLVLEVRRGAGRTADQAVRTIAAAIEVPPRDGYTPLVLFNPLPWGLDHAHVQAHLPIAAADGSAAFEVVDGRGQRVAILGSEVVRNNLGLELTDEMFVDPRTRRRLPSRTFGPIVERQGSVLRLQLAQVRLPSAGYAILYARPIPDAPRGPDPEVVTSTASIENEFVTVRCDAKGLTAIWDRLADRPMLVDAIGALRQEEDVGSAWHTAALPNSQFDLRSQSRIEVRVLRGRDAEVIRIDGVYEPNSLENGRSGLQSVAWTQRITLIPGDPAVHVRTEVDWHAVNTRLQLLFQLPFEPRDDRALYEIPFGVLERPRSAPRYGTFNDARNGDWPALNVVCCADPDQDYAVALFNRGLPCHQVRHGIISATVLRSPNMPGYHYFGCDGVRDGGRHVFEHRIRSFTGGNLRARLVRAGMEFNTPCFCVPVSPHPGALPPCHSFLRHTAESVVISAIKRGEDDERLVVRGYEVDGHAASDTVEVSGAGAGGAAESTLRMQETDLLEEGGRPVAAIAYRPYEIKTIAVG